MSVVAREYKCIEGPAPTEHQVVRTESEEGWTIVSAEMNGGFWNILLVRETKIV